MKAAFVLRRVCLARGANHTSVQLRHYERHYGLFQRTLPLD